jgi:acyl-homoserine-lactone acylase
MGFRPQRSARMLDEDASITLDQLVAYKHSTRMELADRILDDLAHAAATSDSPLVEQAAKVLATWDRSADSGSRGAVLFYEFWREVTRRAKDASPFATPWSEANPRTTPDGFANPAEAVTALEAAAATVRKTHGALDVAWGDVYRLRRAGLDLAGNGGPDALGIFRNVAYDREKDGKYAAVAGDSFVAAVEFSSPVRAMVLVGYGNASQPGSTHIGDQVQLFAAKKLRQAWLTRGEIEKHLESRRAF